MRRLVLLLLFPILAATAGLSLLVRLVAGMVSLTDVQGVSEPIAMLSTVLAHGLADEYLETCESKIKAKVEAEGLPDWVGAQAAKNCGKAGLYECLGFLLSFLVMCSWTGVFRGRMSDVWLDGLMAFNLAFQAGAFVGEYVIMAAQARLLRDVEGWAKKPDACLVDSVA